MVLNDEAREDYFRLRNPFLDYCRKRLSVKGTAASGSGEDVARDTFAVVQAVREHPEIHDQYLEENPHQLEVADQAKLSRWKEGLGGHFIIAKLLKKGAVLAECNEPYRHFLVLGITSPVEALCQGPAPVMVKAHLLPFGDVVIVDGFVENFNIYFGGGMKRNVNAEYQAARRSGKIWTSLDGPPATPVAVPAKKSIPNWEEIVGAVVADCERLRGSDSESLNAAFSLLRASAQLTEVLVHDRGHAEARKKLSAIRRALTSFQNHYYT